jgi:molybdopterin converting factor small subunit
VFVVKVNLPTPLIEYTGGVRDVAGEGGTLDALLRDLDRQYPGIRFRMIDEQDQVRAHIKLFVNGELERSLASPLKGGDVILIVAALSGG